MHSWLAMEHSFTLFSHNDRHFYIQVLPVIMDTFHCVALLTAAVFLLIIGFLLCDFLAGLLFPETRFFTQTAMKRKPSMSFVSPVERYISGTFTFLSRFLSFELRFSLLFKKNPKTQKWDTSWRTGTLRSDGWTLSIIIMFLFSASGLKHMGINKTVSSKWGALFIDTQKVLLHQGNKSALFSGGCHLCVVLCRLQCEERPQKHDLHRRD